MKDKNWFVERINADILRGTNRIKIKDYAMAEKLHDLQDDQYKFSDPVVIHKVMQECEACSA